MKKILYLLGVDWNWIFQRPQILGTKLAKDYDVFIIYPKQVLKKWKNQDNKFPCGSIKYGIWFPFQDKFKILKNIFDITFKKAIGDTERYDIIWIGEPTLYRFIPSNYKGTVVYDCMDNYEAIERKEDLKHSIAYWEKKLIKRANIIFASSNELIKKMYKIDSDKKFVLLRNGYLVDKIHKVDLGQVKKKYKLAYIGTIAEWFDNEIIEQSLNVYNNIEYYLIGPFLGEKKMEKSNICYQGIIEHHKLYGAIENYDCLIMPFIVNEIVLYVDPVKLYEYISYGKCIISIFYPELEVFSDFVYFYNNKEEFNQLLNTLIENGFIPKYDKQQQVKFLENNSWEERYKKIKAKLDLKMRQ